jgi:hypothetical protein
MALTRDKFFRQIDSLIKSDGFAFICIGGDTVSPRVAYTVGLTETYGCPELMIFGVGHEVANVVFHAVVSKIRAGGNLKDGDVLVNVLNLPCTIRHVTGEAASPYALNVIRRYEGSAQKPAFQQIVYPDQANVLPWEPGYDERLRRIQRELWTSLH